MKDITKTMPNKTWRCIDLWDIIHEDICRRFSSVGRDADSNSKVPEFKTWRWYNQSPLNISELNFLKYDLEHDEPG